MPTVRVKLSDEEHQELQKWAQVWDATVQWTAGHLLRKELAARSWALRKEPPAASEPNSVPAPAPGVKEGGAPPASFSTKGACDEA